MSRIAGRFRLRHLWLIVPFWGLALRASLPLRDNSFMWHVRAGVDQLASGEVIRTDPYSFTRFGEPWRTQSWLIELVYGQLERWFPGLSWTPWFLFAVVGAALGVVLAVLWARGGVHVGVLGALVTIGWLSQPYVQPRPVAITFVLFALTGVLMSVRRQMLWAIPLVIWLWAAVHGSFVVGLVFFGLDALRRRSRRQGVAVAIAFVAAGLTAHGLAIWQVMLAFVANRDGLGLLQEWQPPDFTTPWLAAFLVVLLLVMVGLAAGRIPINALWVVAPAVVFGLTSARSVLPAALLLAPWLGHAVQAVPDRRETAANPLFVWATALTLAVSAVAVLARPVRVDETMFPSQPAIDAGGRDRTFTTVAAAGYLIYKDPGRLVLIDDRVELYGAELLRRYERAVNGGEWRGLFTDYGIERALLPTDSDLLERLVEGGWQRCFEDQDFVVAALGCE